MLRLFSLVLFVASSCFSFPQYEQAQQQQEQAGINEQYKPLCEEGYACVPWQACAGGDGTETQQKPDNYEEFKCEGEGNMCCSVSRDLLTSIFEGLGDLKGDTPGQKEPVDQSPTTCGHASYDCVPYFQCVNGVINTDGAGLIDVRIKPPANCLNPDYPDVPAVCCLIPNAVPTPVPIESCPQYQECVDFKLCSANGTIITDGSGLIDIRTGYTSCYLPSGIGGRCCYPPPPYVDACPGKSVCTLGDSCLGQALDGSDKFIDYSSNGYWSHCSLGHSDGVCCIPPPPKVVDKCPGESVCTQQHECTGTALDEAETFVDYTSEGSWTYCSEYEGGVCCINPYVEPEPGPASHCGVRNYNIKGRITAKTDASFGEFPWQAIIFYQNYTFNCGASLISHKHILTAAHCISGLNPSDIKLRLGEWQVNSFDEKLPYFDKNVHYIYIHPKFNQRNLQNDIAVIELLEPIDYKYHINSICLPSPGQSFKGKTCFASGWGKDSFQGQFQPILKKIELPYIGRRKCQNLLRKTRLGRYFRLHNSFLCAGGLENEDACYGDGGGPLACKDEVTSQYVLTGITSWGIGCGTKDVPGVYVNVLKYVDWINGIVGGGKGNQKQQQQQQNQKY